MYEKVTLELMRGRRVGTKVGLFSMELRIGRPELRGLRIILPRNVEIRGVYEKSIQGWCGGGRGSGDRVERQARLSLSLTLILTLIGLGLHSQRH